MAQVEQKVAFVVVHDIRQAEDHFINMERSLHPHLLAAHKEAAERLKGKIGWGYKRATSRARRNTPLTLAWKRGDTPLVDSGTTKKAFQRAETEVGTHGDFIIGKVTLKVPTAGIGGALGLRRKNKAFPYILSHIHGAGPGAMRVLGCGRSFTIPPRDPLTEGVTQGIQGAAITLARAYQAYFNAFIKPKAIGDKVVPFHWERQLTPQTSDIYKVALPPSLRYSAVGFTSDFTSAISLSFSTFNANAWFATLGAGHMGITKQPFIRRARKSIYGGALI